MVSHQITTHVLGQVLLVTGASRGIGAAIARLAGCRGYRVGVNYATREDLAETVVRDIRTSGGDAIAVQADIGNEADVKRLFWVVQQELGPITALVNNASITGGKATLATVTVEQISHTFRTDLLGTILCIREAVQYMSKSTGYQGGVIVNVSSTAARTSGAFEWVHYASIKAAVNTLTRGAALELAQEQIRVNAVAPGLILTDLHADNGMPERPERLRPTVPMQRIGSAEEVAHAVLWLLSEEASYVTGSILDVSGGR